MICFLFLSLWKELSQERHIYMLHSKSALRKAELPQALHWFAGGGNSGRSAGPAPPAAVGAGEGDTESLIQCVWLLMEERVFKEMLICWSGSIQPPLWGWQSSWCSLGHRERVRAGRRGGSKHTGFDHRASKGGSSARSEICSGVPKVKQKNVWGWG